MHASYKSPTTRLTKHSSYLIRHVPRNPHQKNSPMDKSPRPHLPLLRPRSPSLRPSIHVRFLLHRNNLSRAQPMALWIARSPSSHFRHRRLAVRRSDTKHHRPNRQPPSRALRFSTNAAPNGRPGNPRKRLPPPSSLPTPRRHDGQSRPHDFLPPTAGGAC